MALTRSDKVLDRYIINANHKSRNSNQIIDLGIHPFADTFIKNQIHLMYLYILCNVIMCGLFN